MNKKMYFALAATAALFASCSSDDLVSESASARQAGFDENGSAKIEFAISTADVTRGTGAVGSVGGSADAQWAGQKFSVLMLQKGTTLGAYADELRTQAIIKGAEQRATGTGVVSLDDDAVYYPTYMDAQGNPMVYDFWAYRLDDAATAPETFTGYDDDNATQVTIPFVIDGTQDVMVAQTLPSAAYDETYLYSAKSARSAIKPTFAFSHLLTQLSFKVKAMDQAMTTAAINPTTDPAFIPGYEIKDIIVKSKSTGDLIAAYTTDEAPTERIVWGNAEDWATPGTLADFHLQTRQRDVEEAADIHMMPISSAAALNAVLNYDANYVDASGNGSFTVTSAPALDALQVYASNALDANTGMPTGAPTTMAALKAAAGGATVTGYILTYRNNTLHSDGVTPWNVPQYAVAAAGVTTNLVPFETNNTNPAGAMLTWTAGAGDAIALGEPMIVAPADANGYTITVKYAYYKKVNNTTVAYTEAFSNPIHVVNKTTNPDLSVSTNPFDAGKRYTVTLKLYPNGEVQQGSTTLDPWADGGELEGDDNE